MTQKFLPLDKRLEIYEIAIGMKKKNLTRKKISNILSMKYGIKIPEETIYRWINKRNKPDVFLINLLLNPHQNLVML